MLPTLDVVIRLDKPADYWTRPELYEGALPGEALSGSTRASGATAGAAISTGQGRSLLWLAGLLLGAWLATKG